MVHTGVFILFMIFGPALHAALPLEKLQLPKGFHVELFAENVKGARQMALSPSGILFVGTRDEGKVYAIQNKKIFVLAQDLNSPNGVAFYDGDLYVAEIHRILRYRNIEKNLNPPPQPQIVYDKLPRDSHHGHRYIRIGTDKKLYVPVGAPCNVCEEKSIFASLNRMNLDGSEFETIARGVRNTVGFDWQPSSGKLWFSEHGRDMMGDDKPACEVNRLDKIGEHFGFPYCHAGDVADDKLNKRKCSEFKPPAQKLGAHVAPMGMRFYKGKGFPKEYGGQIFLAEHGSWNRTKKIGYRVTLLRVQGDQVVSYEPFVQGWMNDQTQEVWGRPVDVVIADDGSLLISDDYAHAIYKVFYKNSHN